jgi:hypothetical protein
MEKPFKMNIHFNEPVAWCVVVLAFAGLMGFGLYLGNQLRMKGEEVNIEAVRAGLIQQASPQGVIWVEKDKN